MDFEKNRLTLEKVFRMKKVLVFILLSSPFFGFCDTLDFWAIYMNDSLIGRYNVAMEVPEIVLKRDSIDYNDTLFIQYGNDHPCVNCEYHFGAKQLSNGVPFDAVRRAGFKEQIPFRLERFLKTKRGNEFEFFVRERSEIKDNLSVKLFILKIE